MSGQELEGGCLCDSVRFRVSGAASQRCYCHCRSCRLASGAPFVAWTTFRADGFRLLRGVLAEHRSSREVLRGFCGACGTAITYRNDARPEEIDVTLATIDDSSSLAPEYHIWVAHKLPWVTLGDQLPQYPEWRESRL